ncbi:hypothetical protein [Gandjariella thermophila]|uniref:hypothetical protein n=1 Tax=Gandjariella thermophila TaxID=1931992 RepID=UPI0010F52EB0|nr:hypothetical protein [Gandjariella thermophila]
MNREDRELVVIIRQTQWLLDEAARDIPGGRYSTENHIELADILESVGALIRRRATLKRPTPHVE